MVEHAHAAQGRRCRIASEAVNRLRFAGGYALASGAGNWKKNLEKKNPEIAWYRFGGFATGRI